MSIQESSTPRRAVVLLSGGLDSSTCLAIAQNAGFDCYCLSLEYGQRHQAELEAAARVAKALGAREHRTLHLALDAFGGSALTDATIAVPVDGVVDGTIPVTYVPARNTIMLSLALAWAEVLQSRDIFVGVNAVDYSGYPDCRPEYISAYEKMANLATPLIDLSKADIVRRGHALGVDYGLTISCYQADPQGRACGACDACRLRSAGFSAAGLPDPTHYKS